MIAKKYRLQISAKNRFLGGKTKKSVNFLCKFKDNNLEFSRFGLVLGQKNAKKAVWRNYIKRNFFRVIQESPDFLRQKKDFLFIALPSLKINSKQDIEPVVLKIRQEIKDLLK